ncbi:hypothetical protein [Jeotgalibacillus sp. R-1-5s-1]|uniref:hypothetical protein n=1 Tax=Jeotgalibacillus sp. R-1-5s-1 TaxID=2555897 RepID=UPI00141B6880|nr:hypothetical protein [Jeotgalibacillus sp. R-1-5s-1]
MFWDEASLTVLIIFVMMFAIGSFLNIMFKTTKRRDWLTMFLFCFVFSAFFVGIFNYF